MQEPKNLAFRVFGGLAGQLAGIAYSIYLHDKLGYRPTIVFDSGGTSYRPPIVQRIMDTRVLRSRGISWRAIRTSNSGVLGRLTSAKQLMFSGLVPATHRYGIIRKDDLHALNSRGVRLHGYPTDFNVIEDVQSEISSAIESSGYPNFLEPTEARDVIAVHWRLGDYVNNPFHGVVTPRSIVEGLDLLNPDWRAKGLEIYTDSPDLLKNKKISNLLASPRIFSGNIWDDLYSMSSAQFFLGNHSGVSQWVALSLLARGKPARVVLPKNWFRGQPDGVEVLPTEAMRAVMIWTPELAMEL